MLVGDRVTLRGIRREDLPRMWQFNNDLEVELAGGAQLRVTASPHSALPVGSEVTVYLPVEQCRVVTR